MSNLGNLEKTEILHKLFNIKPQFRKEIWVEKFLLNIADASFTCEEPQVIEGSDGFSYFHLRLPTPGMGFQCYTVSNIKEFCLENGLGIFINGYQEQPEWIFTYGDIFHFFIHHTFFMRERITRQFETTMQDIELTPKSVIAIGGASEKIFPLKARTVVKQFLNAKGLNNPNYLLMNNKGKLTLCFNITPNSFSDPSSFDLLMNALHWFFPKYYDIAGFEDNENFVEL